jgi:hypothetical protein
MRHRTDDQKSAYVSLACLRYAAKPLLASKGELPWHESKPRRKITPATEGPHCRCEGFNRQSNHRPDTRHGLKTPCRAVDSGKLGELLRFRLDQEHRLRPVRRTGESGSVQCDVVSTVQDRRRPNY